MTQPRHIGFTASLLILLSVASCGKPATEKTEENKPQDQPAKEQTSTPVAKAISTDWTHNGLSWRENRHSPLDQINKENIGELGLAWTFDSFVVRGRVHRGNQGTPLVVGETMYFTGPWSVVYAVNAKTGEELWVYDPEADGAWARKTCCDVNNKGVAYKDGRIYVGVVDGYLDAVDAKTGERIWRVDTLVDRYRSYSVTGAPRLAGDNIIIGNGGADMDARGYVSAYNLETGELAWRFFTVPGAPDKGDEHPELTMARETWGPDSLWEIGGGGTVYDGIAYDPELDIVYAGTSNGVPHPVWIRDPSGGDNLFLSSILAIDNATGRLRWHYQTVPADSWDFGSTQNMVLADLEIDGKLRKVIMQAPKNGFFYVLDRATGELLSAEKYSVVTWASHVDMETGRPVVDPSLDFQHSPKIIWPSVSGAHNWQPMAYNPDAKLVYIPVLEAPMKYVGYDSVEYQPGSLNEAKGPPLMPPFDDADAHLLEDQPEVREDSITKAWDPVTGKVVWESERQPWWSGGLLSTAGGLIFQGATNGDFMAIDADTGKVLKRINTGLAILAPPMTYEIDGVQYVAVLGGLGGSESAYFPWESAAQKYENPETLYVFKLGGGNVTMPPMREPEEKQPLPEIIQASAEDLEEGAQLYYHNCARCHSYRGSDGSYPSLWNMTPSVHENFEEILLEGTFSYAGMASFKDILSKDDSRKIHAFLTKDVHDMVAAGEDGSSTRFGNLETED